MSTTSRRKTATPETESGPTPKPTPKAKRARANASMESGKKEVKAKKAASGELVRMGNCSTETTIAERRLEVDAWRRTFLAVLSRTCNVQRAAHQAGVDRATVYAHRRADPAFRLAWRNAKRDAVRNLEATAWRRATVGYTETTVERGREGKRVTTKHRTDSRLMMFLLKAHAPEKYKDRSSVELTAVAAPQVDPALQRAMLADPEVCRLQSELDARLSLLRQQVASPPALPGPVVVEVEGSHGEKGTDEH